MKLSLWQFTSNHNMGKKFKFTDEEDIFQLVQETSKRSVKLLNLRTFDLTSIENSVFIFEREIETID